MSTPALYSRWNFTNILDKSKAHQQPCSWYERTSLVWNSMSLSHVHVSVYTLLFLVLFLPLSFCGALMSIFLFCDHVGYIPVLETLEHRALCRLYLDISIFNYLCRFCFQQWGLDVSLWSTTYSLDNSLSCRRISIEPLWSASIIWFSLLPMSYLVSGDHPGSVKYEFHLVERVPPSWTELLC